MMSNVLGHLKTVLVHKYYVMIYCIRLGIPLQGVLHDLSKLSPCEFTRGVKYFTGSESPVEAERRHLGHSVAWIHHKGRNKHHYQYWNDNSTYVPMPFKYFLELIADYLAAGRTYQGSNFSFQQELTWWNERKQTISDMDPGLMVSISECLEVAVKSNAVPSRGVLKYIYTKNVKQSFVL